MLFPNYNPPSAGQQFPSRQGGNAFGIQFVFRGVNPLVQRFGRIVVQDRHRLLSDDRAGIDPGIDKMHSAAREFHAMIQRLFPRVQPGE